MSLPTPKYNLKNYPQVYEPSEDTFLFLDALEQEIDFLRQLQPVFVVEIGSGSGVVITALSTIIKNCVCFATDINREACEATLQTGLSNGIDINCINMDLLSNFQCKFDLILFNPPYVVTESKEIVGRGLNRAWAGGCDGREITNKLLFNLDKYLSEIGVCYMLLLKENNIEEIQRQMSENNFRSDIVMNRKIRGEHLFVVKFESIFKNTSSNNV